MALTESEELELLELEEEEAKAMSQKPKEGFLDQLGNKAKAMGEGMVDTAKRLPAGVGKLLIPDRAEVSNARWGEYLMSLGLEGLPASPTITGEILPAIGGAGSAALAGLRGKDMGQAYTATSEGMRQGREQVLQDIDPDIRAAANVTGMVAPSKLAAIGVDIGAPIAAKAARGADFEDVASDVALAGGVTLGIPAATKVGRGAVNLATDTGAGIAKLPARMQGIKGESITEYIAQPEAVKAASRTSTEGRITASMEDLLKAREDASMRLEDVKAQLAEAEAIGAKDKTIIARDVETAKAEVDALDAMFKQAQEAEIDPLRKQKFEVGEKLKDERAARAIEVEEAGQATREALKGAVEGVQESSVKNQEKLSQAARQLDALLTQTDTKIPTVLIKQQLMEDIKPLGVPQQGVPSSVKVPETMIPGGGKVDYSPVTYAYKDPQVNKILEMVQQMPEYITATQLLNMKRIVGDAAYKAGAGSGRLDATYRAMNGAITEVAGNKFPELNAEITSGLKVKEPLDALKTRAESVLPKIGKKGGIGAEATLADLGENVPSDIIQQYLSARQAEEALKKSQLPSTGEARGLNKSIFETKERQKSEVRPGTDADTMLRERSAEKKMLDEYLNSIREQGAKKQAMAGTQLDTATSSLNRLGITPSEDLTQLPKWVRNQVMEGPLEGPTSRLPEVSKVMGTTQESMAAEIRAVNAREDIYGREPKVPFESALSLGVVPALRSAFRAGGAGLATKSMDVARILQKAKGTKWAPILEKYNLNGRVSFAHYLLQQMDPEYAKAMSEED